MGKLGRMFIGPIEGADAIVLMTAHREFREIDLRRVREGMRTAVEIYN